MKKLIIPITATLAFALTACDGGADPEGRSEKKENAGGGSGGVHENKKQGGPPSPSGITTGTER